MTIDNHMQVDLLEQVQSNIQFKQYGHGLFKKVIQHECIHNNAISYVQSWVNG